MFNASNVFQSIFGYINEFKKTYFNVNTGKKYSMRRPGIEPRSNAWKASMLTITPPTLTCSSSTLYFQNKTALAKKHFLTSKHFIGSFPSLPIKKLPMNWKPWKSTGICEAFIIHRSAPSNMPGQYRFLWHWPIAMIKIDLTTKVAKNSATCSQHWFHLPFSL